MYIQKDASRPEPEVARPEVESFPVEKPSFGSVAAVGGRSQLVVEKSESGIEPLSGYPLPARHEPEMTPISSPFSTHTVRSFSDPLASSGSFNIPNRLIYNDEIRHG